MSRTSMAKRISCTLATILISVCVLHAQSGNRPFAALEEAVKEERGGWSGNKERLSTVFDAERRRLGDEFETELLKWLGHDPEKHYWVSSFLEVESYLHGSNRLPYLSLLVKQEGLALVRGKDDEESRRYAVGLSTTAAVLSAELGFPALASSYKSEAEGLLLRQPELSTSVPGLSETDHRRYDGIASTVSRKTRIVVGDSNPQPHAPISGGILNGRSLNKVKPGYPRDAHESGASGTVEVKVVIDEIGNVIWVKALSGHPLLRSAAEGAAWQAKFPPTKLSGKPVRVSGVLLYNFVP